MTMHNQIFKFKFRKLLIDIMKNMRPPSQKFMGGPPKIMGGKGGIMGAYGW